MASTVRLLVSLGSLLLLPCLVSCSYSWPDNVTQHKGYIEVREKN